MTRPPLWYLQKLAVFADLPELLKQRLGHELQCERYAKAARAMIVDRGETVFVVAQGAAKLGRFGLFGRRIIETIVSANDLFGSISGGGKEQSLILEPIEELHLIRIPSTSFSELVRDHPEFAFRVIQTLEDRQRELHRKLEGLLYKDLTTRVIETINWLAREHGDRCKHGWAMDIRVTQQDLADLCGATRQAVSAVLGKLERRLILSRKGRIICILSMKRLANMIQPESDTIPDAMK